MFMDPVGEGNGKSLQYSCQRIPWTEPGGLLSIGSHRVGHDCSGLACMHAWAKEMATHPTDGGAWWAAVYEVAQSWTRLKRLSSSMDPVITVVSL